MNYQGIGISPSDKEDAFRITINQRPYFPIISPCARMCPDIAASSWDLVAPLFKLSVISRAYTLKKYLWGLPGGGQGLVLWYRSGQPGAVDMYIVDHPVDPGFADGVRVVHYQGDGPGAWVIVFHESAGERSSPSQVCSTGMLLSAL